MTKRRCLRLSLFLACCILWPSSAQPSSLSDRTFDAEIRQAVSRFWGDFPYPMAWKAQLFQESGLNPNAESEVGAAGLAQMMPGTAKDIARGISWGKADPHNAKFAIDGGAYYMAQLRKMWGRGRTPAQKHDLGLASYNAGPGSILKAQQACGDALLWLNISPCLASVTGDANARQTLDYVTKIHRWWDILERMN